MENYDAIVVGVGGMGSAALFHLARRNCRVLGLDSHSVPNDRGSSHGETRIIRLGYFEHPSYVPLLRRAYELWRELETASAESLLTVTGGLDTGAPDSRVFSGSLAACREHRLEHEVLTGEEVNRRHPGYRLPATHRAVFQRESGYLSPEACVAAHARMAVGAGARLKTQQRVTGWERGGPGVIVHTAAGEFGAERLILSPGAWAADLLPTLSGLAVPERQVVAWFRPAHPEIFAPATFPIFINEVAEGMFYGFPLHGTPGFKLGRFHHREERAEPDALDRTFHPADEEVLRNHVQAYFPDADGEVLKASTCMFTNTPDEHFIIDHHPEVPGVVLAAGFSGHGFKFCSVVGEILAQLILEGATNHDIGLFALSRFGATPGV